MHLLRLCQQVWSMQPLTKAVENKVSTSLLEVTREPILKWWPEAQARMWMDRRCREEWVVCSMNTSTGQQRRWSTLQATPLPTSPTLFPPTSSPSPIQICFSRAPNRFRQAQSLVPHPCFTPKSTTQTSPCPTPTPRQKCLCQVNWALSPQEGIQTTRIPSISKLQNLEAKILPKWRQIMKGTVRVLAQTKTDFLIKISKPKSLPNNPHKKWRLMTSFSISMLTY